MPRNPIPVPPITNNNYLLEYRKEIQDQLNTLRSQISGIEASIKTLSEKPLPIPIPQDTKVQDSILTELNRITNIISTLQQDIKLLQETKPDTKIQTQIDNLKTQIELLKTKKPCSDPAVRSTAQTLELLLQKSSQK